MKEENLCGFIGWHPKWLQKYANSKTFLIVYGLLGTIQSMAFMYFVVTLTTMEKRFKIPSQTTGIIISGNEISQILLSLILSYAGGQQNRPRWIAWGVVFCSLSCFVLVLPHIMYGPGDDILKLTKEYMYHNDDPSILNSTDYKIKDANKLCSAGQEETECDELFSIVPLILIFLSQFVLGIGTTLYYSLGQSYLDDNTKKTNTPMMLAYAMSLRMLGPALGFVLGYFSLNIFVDPTKTPLINKSDPRWLGAWWLGWLIIGFSVLIFAVLMGMFPKEMPKKKIKIDVSETPRMLLAEGRNQQLENGKSVRSSNCQLPSDNKDSVNMKEFLPSLLRLLKNKLLMFNILAGIFYILGSSAYVTFLNKYMEVQYNRSSADAAVVIGPVSILGLVFGFLLSGWYISKYKPSLRKLFLWNTFVGTCYILGQFSYIFLTCDNGSVITSNGMLNITNSCNSKCSCDNVPYSPVCLESTKSTFFSPCHAGCDAYNDKTKRYNNCHCTNEMAISKWLNLTTPLTIATTNSVDENMLTTTATSPIEITTAFTTNQKTTQEHATVFTNSTNLDIVLKSEMENKTALSQYNVGETEDEDKTTSSLLNREKRSVETYTSNTIIDDDDEEFLIPGVCLAGCATAFYIMSGISCFINTLGGTGRISNMLLNFRVVSKEDKSFAQGLTLMLISLFALIPGPIIYGYIIDSTCLIWNYKCESRGNCQLYDQKRFRYYINVVGICLTSLGVICDIFIWYYGKNIDLYGEEEAKRQQQIEKRNQHISPLLSKSS